MSGGGDQEEQGKRKNRKKRKNNEDKMEEISKSFILLFVLHVLQVYIYAQNGTDLYRVHCPALSCLAFCVH